MKFCSVVFGVTLRQGSSRTGTNGNSVPVLFYTTGTSFPWFFSVYSNVVNCNFPWKSFGYKADSLADSDICVYVYDIMDDLSAM